MIEYLNSNLWAVFVLLGLLAILLELFVGVETGFDLVMLGSAFIIGGISSWHLHSWIFTASIVSVICMLYVVIGRKYVQSHLRSPESRTNVDALIGKSGVVEDTMNKYVVGSVQIGYELWRARTVAQTLDKGDIVKVTGVTGITLIVTKEAQ